MQVNLLKYFTIEEIFHFDNRPTPLAQQSLVGQSLLIVEASQDRDLYLTTHNTQKRKASQVGFEPAIPASKWLQTHT
jgi:hypothetical protein